MPAKRSPKKSREPLSGTSLPDLTPPDLDTLALAPSARVVLSATPQVETPPASKAGPPPGRDARFTGSSQRLGQTRRYAFRRS